jgi:UDP-glucose:(heptosyl)LPS alpha-1,3-glucosyltransferase
LKILLIRKNYSPYGGAENYLNLVFKGLQARGHDVHILSADYWDESLSKVHKVSISIRKPSFLSNMSFALNTGRFLKRQSFDCILSFERIPFKKIPYSSNSIYRAGDGCHREWLRRRKIAESFLRRLSFSLNPHHLTLLYLEKRCFLNCRLIIANSKMVKRDIMRHYSVPDEKIEVVYNGIDLQRFQPVGKRQKTELKNFLGIKEDKVVLFVGTDFKRKGLSTLLKACSLLGMDNMKLITIGKADTRHYSSLARKLGIEKKVFFSRGDKEIEKFYLIADVFVLPTIYDPFSNATLEAMASGLPVITTSSNGASELIEDRVEGFVINNPLDIKAFAEKIPIALSQAEDMGKKARTKAEDYPIEKAVDEIIRVISKHGG